MTQPKRSLSPSPTLSRGLVPSPVLPPIVRCVYELLVLRDPIGAQRYLDVYLRRRDG